MLMRTEWYEPRPEPPPPRRVPGRFLTLLFWACMVVFVLTQLLIF